MAEEEEKLTPAAEEVEKNEDAAKEGDTKNEEDCGIFHKESKTRVGRVL